MGLTIKNMRRGSGKTICATSDLIKNESSILIIPNSPMYRLYPKQYHNRIITVDNFLRGHAEGVPFDKIIIDEGFLPNKLSMAEFYYELGKINVPVRVYGTL